LKIKKTFQEFLETKDEAIKFFRELLSYLNEVSVQEYRLFIRNQHTGFAIETRWGKDDNPPPLTEGPCFSCDTKSDVAKFSLVESTEYHSIWLDARGRACYILTPNRHTEKLVDLGDDELFSFWWDIFPVLTKEKGGCVTPNTPEKEKAIETKSQSDSTRVSEVSSVKFAQLEVNQGDYRKLPHLHLKAFLDQKEFNDYRRKWSPERQEKFRQLKEIFKKEEAQGNKRFRNKHEKRKRFTHPSAQLK